MNARRTERGKKLRLGAAGRLSREILRSINSWKRVRRKFTAARWRYHLPHPAPAARTPHRPRPPAPLRATLPPPAQPHSLASTLIIPARSTFIAWAINNLYYITVLETKDTFLPPYAYVIINKM